MSEWTNFNNVDDIFRSSTEGLPDNHVITVRERYLDVDIPDLIQNNIKTDTITLDLDAEWEGITPVIILGSADDAVEVYYNGDPVTIPSQVAKEVGRVDCSVTGYDATGTVRLVTVAAPDTFQVIESGLYTGEVPEEEGTSLLGQLLDAAKDAQAAADSAEDKIETIDTKLTEVDTKLTEVDTEVDTKLTEVDTKLTEVDTKLTEVDTKVVELTTVAGNAQKAAQNAQTAAETAQKAAEDAENSVTDAIFMDATDEKPGEKFLTDADGNVLQDVYLTTANGVGDKEQYVNIGRSGEINGVVVHGGRAHAQLWTRASADGQHDAYLNMYNTLDDGTRRSVLQAGYQNENTHVMLWDRDNPDARSGSFQPNRLVMADVENDAQADFKPTVGYFDSSGSQAIISVTDPGENGINAVMGFGNSGTGKVLSRIGVTDGTSVLELNDHTVNDISLDSFADAENPSNKNLVTEKAVKAAIDAIDIPEALPEGGTEGQVLTKTAGGKAWQDIPEALPEGGTLGQVLTKTDDGEAWQDAPEADMTNVAKIVGNQLVSYDGSSIDYVNVRGESSDSYGRVSGMGGIGFVSAGTGNDFIRLKSDSSGQCIGIRKDGVDTEYTISDTISETENTLATGKAVVDYVEAQTKKNVLVSTATGKVAHAEDAFAEKPREVRIKGKTWKNLWPVISGTSNGVTVSTDDTGLITVSGTPTVDVYLTNGQNIAVTPGAKMSYMVTNVELFNANSRPYVQFFDADGSPSSNTPLHVGNSLTVPDGASEARCYIAVYPSKPVNGSFRVMLVEGDTAPDCFVPTGLHSVESTKLTTAGKNLLRLLPNLAPLTTNGITFTPQDDGGILANGTATSIAYYNLDFKYDTDTSALDISGLNGQTVTCSGHTSGVRLYVGCFTDIASRSYVTVCRPGVPTGTIPKDGQAFRSFLEVTSGTTVNNVTVYPQLELGSTATAYEPPNITTTPLPEVELRSLPDGTCDELVIGADGTCRVERKTVQVTFDGSQTFIAEERYGRYRFRYDPDDAGPISESIGLYSNNLIASTDPLIGNVVEYAICQCSVNGLIFFSLGDETTAKEANAWFADNPTTVIYWATGTENKSPVTLPVLPAPTFNQYHDSQVPSDTSVTYENDVNITISNMQKTIDALLGGN